MLNVRVPASSANLGAGFDLYGVALPLYNELRVTPGESLSIHAIGPEASGLPADASNLTQRAAMRVCQQLDKPLPTWRLEAVVRIPQARGLGSSSAAIVAGLLAANAWYDMPLTRDDLMQLAVELEGHPDNVAAALYGGVCWAQSHNGRIQVVPVSDHIPGALVLAIPDLRLSTALSRQVLPKLVPHRDAVATVGAVTALTTVLLTGQHALWPQALSDHLHEPYRMPLIPGGLAVKDAALAQGAWGVVISGAGPSLLAVCPEDVASRVAQAMQQAWEKQNVGCHSVVVTELAKGALVC